MSEALALIDKIVNGIGLVTVCDNQLVFKVP